MKLLCPVKGAWGEVFGANGDVKLLEDSLQSGITLRFLLNLKGELLKVCKGSRPVALAVVFIGLGVWDAGRSGSGNGLIGYEVGQQVRRRRSRHAPMRLQRTRSDVFVHGGDAGMEELRIAD